MIGVKPKIGHYLREFKKFDHLIQNLDDHEAVFFRDFLLDYIYEFIHKDKPGMFDLEYLTEKEYKTVLSHFMNGLQESKKLKLREKDRQSKDLIPKLHIFFKNKIKELKSPIQSSSGMGS